MKRISLFMILLVLGCHVQRGVIHRVEQGDTLVQVAHVYGVSIENILTANHLSRPDELRPGQKILIPGVEQTQRIEKSVWELEDVAQAVEQSAGPEPLTVSPLTESEPLPAKAPVPPEKKVTKIASVAPQETKKVKGLVLSWPTQGKVVSSYGMRGQKMHNGIDLWVTSGASIRSIGDGKVVYVGRSVEGYGNLIIVKHPSALFSVYAYLGQVTAKKGAELRRGDSLALANMSSESSFIHFEIRQGKRALDPVKFLPKTKKPS